MPALVQITACHRAGDKPSSEPMMVSLFHASLGFNELNTYWQAQWFRCQQGFKRLAHNFMDEHE